jgi:hypothetical protein
MITCQCYQHCFLCRINALDYSSCFALVEFNGKTLMILMQMFEKKGRWPRLNKLYCIQLVHVLLDG